MKKHPKWQTSSDVMFRSLGVHKEGQLVVGASVAIGENFPLATGQKISKADLDEDVKPFIYVESS
jgi:hypothetical protein